MSVDNSVRLLREANNIALKSLELGKHPFGAILVAPDGSTILSSQCNVDTVNHAESTLARTAASNYSRDFLWDCTLYSTVEPCCMCSGTIYWANIGTVVYGITEQELLAVTGNHVENPTMSLPCRTVFQHGQKPIEVFGPFDEVIEEILTPHEEFWINHPTIPVASLK